MSKPTVEELDEHLQVLVHWESFGIRLPQIEQEDIGIIKKDKRDDVRNQKLGLYETWLRRHPDASWEALEKVKENTIVRNLMSKFPPSRTNSDVT